MGSHRNTGKKRKEKREQKPKGWGSVSCKRSAEDRKRCRLSTTCCLLFAAYCLLLSLLVTDNSPAASLERPGLRARGMGGAFSAVANDGSAGLWNPAGLGQLARSEVTAIAGRLMIGLDRDQLAYGFLSYVEPLPIGAVGLAGSQFASELYKESELIFSFSQKLGDLYLGANLKGLFVSVTENEYTTIDPLFQQHGLSRNQWSVDVGLLWRASDGFSVAIAASDLNRPNSTFSSTVDESQPLTLRTGLYLWDTIALDVSYRMHEISDKPDWNVYLGTEWWFDDRVAIRAGFNRDTLAGGGSFTLPYGANAVQLDYAVQYPMPFGDHLEGTWGSHLLAVSMKFGKQRSIPREWGFTEAERDTDIQVQRRGISSSELPADASIEDAIRQVETGEAGKQTYRRVAQYYRKASALSEAAAVYEKAVDIYPEDLSLLYEFGKICEQLARDTRREQWLDKAAQAYEAILKQDKNYQDASLRITKIRIQRGNVEEAFKGLEF